MLGLILSFLRSLPKILSLVDKAVSEWKRQRQKRAIKKEVQVALDEAKHRTKEQAHEIEQEVLRRFDPDNIPEWMLRYQRDE